MKIAEISGFIYKKLKDINYVNKESMTHDLIDLTNLRYSDRQTSHKDDLTFLIAFLNFTKVPLNIKDQEYGQNKEKTETKV